MTIFKDVHKTVASAIGDLQKSGELALSGDVPNFNVEPPRDAAHGDIATNAAMTLTKLAGKPPRAIAELLKGRLEKNADITSVDIAGPGFINLRLKNEIWLN